MLWYRNMVPNLWAALKALKAHVRHILIFHVFGPGSTTHGLLSEIHCQFSFIIHCSKKLLLNCNWTPTGPQITLLQERHGKFTRIMVQETYLVFSTLDKPQLCSLSSVLNIFHELEISRQRILKFCLHFHLLCLFLTFQIGLLFLFFGGIHYRGHKIFVMEKPEIYLYLLKVFYGHTLF